MTVPLWGGVSAFADRYDAFVIDLWGVLHDGVTAYAGAADALYHLKDMGKRVVLLSNAPRRARVLVAAMEEMGLPRGSYDAILSSGEAVWQKLIRRADPGYVGLGARLFFIGQERDLSLIEGLDHRVVADPAEADFILVCGPFDFDDPIEAYRPLIACCAETLPPMICANPDRAVIRMGKTVVCAGNIADLYAARGGSVVFTGKPDAAIYADALALIGDPPRNRVVGIGDAFATDIAGCRAAGIDAVLCTGGVHAAELGVRHGEAPSAEAVAALAECFGMAPVGAIPAFVR